MKNIRRVSAAIFVAVLSISSVSAESERQLEGKPFDDKNANAAPRDNDAAPAEISVSPSGVTKPSVNPDLALSLASPDEQIAVDTINQLVHDIDGGNLSKLDQLQALFDYPSPLLQLRTRRILATLVVGTFPSRLENRLGDYSEDDLKTKGDEIIKQHECLVADLKLFAKKSSQEKQLRTAVLKALGDRKSLLSEMDQAYVDRQISELGWSDEVTSYHLANALVMLAFNYNYFRGLNAGGVVRDTLKQAMQTNAKLASDTVFIETATKALAHTDTDFCAEYKKITGKDFLPAAL